MKHPSEINIIDITKNNEHQKYLYKCLAPMPFRKYQYRQRYLEKAIQKGFHKKLLTLKGEVVGSIEYAPPEASGYPITGHEVIVMNCIWILRKAKGHNLGRLLLEDMIQSEKQASGFATIALEHHWSPWFTKDQVEKLGFKPIDSVMVAHRTKHKEKIFKIHLMWMPTTKSASCPTWDKQRLLEGETFCMAHPLYRPQEWKGTLLKLT